MPNSGTPEKERRATRLLSPTQTNSSNSPPKAPKKTKIKIKTNKKGKNGKRLVFNVKK